jgi:hypothetical protein
LFQGLSAAEDNTNSTIESSLGLGGNKLVVFLEDNTTLGVAKKGPGDVTILELIDWDLSGEGTIGLVENILGCNFEAGLKMFTSEEKIECRRSNYDLCQKSWSSLADVRRLRDSVEKELRTKTIKGMYTPVFGSNFASLRYPMIFLMVSTEPFLYAINNQLFFVLAQVSCSTRLLTSWSYHQRRIDEPWLQLVCLIWM